MTFLTDPNQNKIKRNGVFVFVKMSLSHLENLAVFKELGANRAIEAKHHYVLNQKT